MKAMLTASALAGVLAAQLVAYWVGMMADGRGALKVETRDAIRVDRMADTTAAVKAVMTAVHSVESLVGEMAESMVDGQAVK